MLICPPAKAVLRCFVQRKANPRIFRHRRSLTYKAIHKTAFLLVESRTGRKCTCRL